MQNFGCELLTRYNFVATKNQISEAFRFHTKIAVAKRPDSSGVSMIAIKDPTSETARLLKDISEKHPDFVSWL